MSSHHDWAAATIEQHDREKPFAPENGQPLKFNVGDAVIYTNDYGVSFGPRRVTGLYQPDTPSSLYATGYRYYLDKDAHWMPVKESSLSAVPAESLTTATTHNPNPWVIVEQAGTDDESIRDDFPSFAKANKALADWYYADELESLGVQIMRRQDDGTLTTEY